MKNILKKSKFDTLCESIMSNGTYYKTPSNREVFEARYDGGADISDELIDAIIQAAEKSGEISFKANAWTKEEAKESANHIYNTGIGGDWGDILDFAWVKTLPTELKEEFEALDDEEKNKLEYAASEIARNTEADKVYALADLK